MRIEKNVLHHTSTAKWLTLMLAILCSLPLSVSGQRLDSLTCGYPHRMQWGQVVAPSLLMGSGALISFTSLHNSIDANLNNWLQRDGHQRCEIENVIQYVPISSVMLLKACGLETKHNWRDIVCLGTGSAILSLALSHGMKYAFHVERPYLGVYTSFPSGHTTTAFFGAEMLRREFGDEYPAIAITGYAVATSVALLRMYNNRHWASDVLAGAGLGILSTSLMYWLAPYLRF